MPNASTLSSPLVTAAIAATVFAVMFAVRHDHRVLILCLRESYPDQLPTAGWLTVAAYR